MNPVFAELAQDHRDALVAYYLGQIVPQHSLPAGQKLVTEQDLYEFLLIDNQVGAQVETSQVAMGMASVQQYLHAIFNGMEPGYLGMLNGDAQQQWRTSKSEYAVWAANQMLQDYPENYIAPDLRLRQTRAFAEFINDVNQSRITTDAVQRALQHYLDKFERISNLDVVSGYIDGMDLRRSDYWFIGRQNVEPFAFYWRKAAVRFDQDNDEADDYLSPTAWSEWLPVDIPKGHTLLHIRPVVIDGRLYAAWIEHQLVQVPAPALRADVPGLYDTVDSYTLNLAYLMLDGSWSVPMVFALNVQKAPSAEDVFVAYVSESDPGDKKIIFAFGRGDHEALVLNARFSLLFQDLMSKATSADYLHKIVRGAKHFLAGGRDFHHPLQIDGDMHVVSVRDPGGEHSTEGFYSPRLRVVATLEIDAKGHYRLSSIGDAYILLLDPSEGFRPRKVTVSHEFYLPGESTPFASQTRSDVPLVGYMQTRLAHTFGDSVTDVPEKLIVRFGIEDQAWRSIGHFDLTLSELPPDRPSLVAQPDGGQFLDLTVLDLRGLTHVRLNTLFGRELVARAMVSVDALLSWDTQHMPEPPLPGQTDSEPMDFHGANGRYFWELFLHVPHAVAWRLHHEFDFQAAERWLNYVFNPQARIKPTQPPSPYYWSVRPLEEPGKGDYEVEGIADPDAIAYSNPVHYRKNIFTFYVRNLLANGDMLYRRLTRDALTEAQLLYTRALSLLGPRPDNRMIGRWQPMSLEEAAKPDETLFASIEAQMPASAPQRRSSSDSPWLELLDLTHFRLPINTELLDLWDELASRLNNLRNNRTLDGKPMQVPLYAPPADPRDLLRAQNSGSGLVQRSVGSLAPIPPFRFRALLPRLQGAVDTLSRFGEQVRLFRELKDRALQEELQQSHLLELSQFGIRLQEAALEQAEAGLVALETSRRVIETRHSHYDRLVDENLSSGESDALELHQTSMLLSAASGVATTVAGAVHLGSLIVTAFGGGHTRTGAALEATASAMNLGAMLTRSSGDILMTTEQYRRRLQDWTLQRDLAGDELAAIDEQITGQRIAIELARIQLSQATRSEQQSQDYYRFLKSRSTNADLYQWLVGQLSTFYFQAYDAVVALCLNGEACWQYEMGDYQTHFVQPNVWFDNYFGLTAGDALRLQLLRMESAWLKRFERRLELVKTISLKALFDGLQHPEMSWDDVLCDLAEGTEGSVAFELSPQLFDGDYPGHYLRQVVSVSVSLPALVGPYQDVRAVLTQVASRTVLKPDPRAMNALYEQPDADSRHILFNPRASQSICLSRGLEDHGVFQLDFNDERYLPFEGTGVMSKWELKFPRHSTPEQQAVLQSLTDIIVQVRYTALDGGPDFAAHVEGLLGD